MADHDGAHLSLKTLTTSMLTSFPEPMTLSCRASPEPLSDVARDEVRGNKPNVDGGNLVLDVGNESSNRKAETTSRWTGKDSLIADRSWARQELFAGVERYCIWVGDRRYSNLARMKLDRSLQFSRSIRPP